MAWKSFWSVLGSGTLPEDVLAELGVAKPMTVPQVAPQAPSAPKTVVKEVVREVIKEVPVAAKAAPATDDSALQLLSLLQREGRLLDFLFEDLTPYTDERVGAVVRGVHDGCRKALDRTVQLAPVVDGVEGTVTTLASAGLKAGDTARLKLMGNVPADGKVDAGILQHKGWQVKSLTLPVADASTKQRVIAPAEIEVE